MRADDDAAAFDDDRGLDVAVPRRAPAEIRAVLVLTRVANCRRLGRLDLRRRQRVRRRGARSPRARTSLGLPAQPASRRRRPRVRPQMRVWIRSAAIDATSTWRASRMADRLGRLFERAESCPRGAGMVDAGRRRRHRAASGVMLGDALRGGACPHISRCIHRQYGGRSQRDEAVTDAPASRIWSCACPCLTGGSRPACRHRNYRL